MSTIHNPQSTLEGLPRSFVNSLHVLFDILDEHKTGFVAFSEIESRWQDGEVEGLPPGVIDALKKVTPDSGRLSFERFVAGLRIALLRHRNHDPSHVGNFSSKSMSSLEQPQSTDFHVNQGGSAFHPFQNSRGGMGSSDLSRHPANTVKVKPNNAFTERTNSMPALQHEQLTDTRPQSSRNGPGSFRPGFIGHTNNEYHGEFNRLKEKWDRKPGDGRSSVATSSALEFMNKNFIEQQNGDSSAKNSGGKRREPRRHTLSSGLDNNMIKRLKLLEQEKDILLQGQEMIQSTKEWYDERLKIVQEKQQYAGRSAGQNDQSLEAYQERLQLQIARIQELNQQLRALMDSPHKGFSLHMNLAVTQSPQRNELSKNANMITMLKSQNRLLTQDVGHKANQIEQLEREKAQLIQKMFNSENRNISYDDTTFI